MQKIDRISFEYCNEIVAPMSSAIRHDAPKVTGLHFYRCPQPIKQNKTKQK